MIVLSEDEMHAVNTDNVESYDIVEKDDSFIIVAHFSSGGEPLTLARLNDPKQAKESLRKYAIAVNSANE